MLSHRQLIPILLLTTLFLVGAASVPAWAQAGTIRFSETLFATNEASGTARIVLRRVFGDQGPVSVTFNTASGSATAGADYTETSTVVSWVNRDGTSKEVLVPILEDTLAEGTETVQLLLSNPTGGAVLGSPSSAQLSIADNDGPSGSCVPSATTLCLQEGRFRVSVAWRTPTGNQGAGMGVQLTGDTGYFWFFNPTNVEMVLKVLRGCPNNGHFWVFAGGLTNVEATITVVDTMTQSTQVYVNPLRTPFEPLQDTSAFLCP